MQIRKQLFFGLSLFAMVAMLGIGVPAALAATSASAAYQTDVEVEEEATLAGEGNKEQSHYCQDLEVYHPVALSIVNRYFETADEAELKAKYEEVMTWFCGDAETKGVGMGQIMLAFQTAERTAETEGDPDTYDMYLTMRAEMGWGKIWQSLGLIGRPQDAEPPQEEVAPQEPGSSVDEASAKITGKPEVTGKPADVGKPEGTGKPVDSGKPDHTGKPEKAAKPEKADKPDKPGKP